MSQTAKQTGTVIAAAPVQDFPLANPVVTRPQPRTLKRYMTVAEAETAASADAAITAQAVLTSQLTGEPLEGGSAQVAGQCPITEAGVADACGLSGAADAHVAAASPLWALALLPLLGAGGGGGGASKPDTTIVPAPNPPDGIKADILGNNAKIIRPINDNPKGDLYDFNSNLDTDVNSRKYIIDKITDGNGNTVQNKSTSGKGPFVDDPQHANPAEDPWFYLDETSGTVYLTNAGASAHCIGSQYVVTVKVVSTNDADRSSTATLTFILDAPSGPGVVVWDADQKPGEKYGDNVSEGPNPGNYDIIRVGNTGENTGSVSGRIASLYFIGPYDGAIGGDTQDELGIFVDDQSYEVIDYYGNNKFEYLTFANEVNFYKYDLTHGNTLLEVSESDPHAYYTLPDFNDAEGSNCNNILFGDFGDSGGSTIVGGSGNDLIFSTWIKIPPGHPISTPIDILSGGEGNDLLIGGWGDDQLFGENGNDVLVGGIGSDLLDGGNGADIFVLNNFNAQDNDVDTIRGFNPGSDRDRILLDKDVFVDGIAAVTFSGGVLSYNSHQIAIFQQGIGLSELSVKNAVIFA